MAGKTVGQMIEDYFRDHPNQDLDHGPVVDAVTAQYLIDHDTPPRDPWRAIRSLHQRGFLIKVRKGIYRYDPNHVVIRDLEDFSADQREEIFQRDNYRCVICGLGRREGVEIQADHIKPKDLGGEARIENGQTLCAKHNFRKKNYNQTESGKKMFIRLYEAARALKDEETMQFCADVLTTYIKYDINGHIIWKP